MTTLRIYGDSFAASPPPEANLTCWPSLLAKKLNLPMINRAIPGSSTEYSIKQLCFDVEGKAIGNTDIVIIVLSTQGRLNFLYQNENPSSAAEYLKEPSKKLKNPHKWYWLNKRFIEWYMVNQDYQMLSINYTAYISLIKEIASTLPNCKFIILENTIQGFLSGLNNYPSNCVRSSVGLNDISNNEFDTKKDLQNKHYEFWTEYTVVDSRQNHLSNPNLKILSDLLVEGIEKMDLTNITYDKFVSGHLNQIKNKKDYMNYVDLDYINYYEWMYNLIEN